VLSRHPECPSAQRVSGGADPGATVSRAGWQMLQCPPRSAGGSGAPHSGQPEFAATTGIGDSTSDHLLTFPTVHGSLASSTRLVITSRHEDSGPGRSEPEFQASAPQVVASNRDTQSPPDRHDLDSRVCRRAARSSVGRREALGQATGFSRRVRRLISAAPRRGV